MLPKAAPYRVMIKNVMPLVEQGKYPAKATVDENFPFSADIFCDGHDELAASVFVRKKGARTWKEHPMAARGNDRWEVILTPSKEGFYEIQVQAWTDPFTTWKKGFLKKHKAGQDISTELLIGAEIIELAAKKASGKTKKILATYSDELVAANPQKAIETVGEENLIACMYLHHRPSLVEYPQVLLVEVERKRASFSTWYELFPRSASKEEGRYGTFQDVEKLLPRISDMGFDVVYLPPVHPIGTTHRKGKNNSLQADPDDPGSPWAIGNEEGGHKSIHPELGTLEDFKQLVSKAAELDMEIALDLAFQCSPDHPYVKQHPEWFRWRPDGTVQYAENPPKKYEDIIPFDFESPDWKNLWQELKSVVDFWIDQGVRIFRVDNPHTKPFPFWEWLIRETRRKQPECIFLAEAFTRPRIMEHLAKIGFNQSYTYFTWRDTKTEMEEYMLELAQTDKRYYFRPNFWPNTPDILPPHLTEGGENAHIIRLVLAATLSSNYGIYGPPYENSYTEPVEGKEEYIDNEKYEIRHWDWDKETRMREIITRVNRIRKQNPALHSTWNLLICPSTNDQVSCYVKYSPDLDNILLMAVSFDPFGAQSTEVTLPEEIMKSREAACAAHDLLSGDRFRCHGPVATLHINPYEMPARILKLDLTPHPNG